MEYRINQRTGDRISVLGFGTSYIAEADERDAIAAIQRVYAGDKYGNNIVLLYNPLIYRLHD